MFQFQCKSHFTGTGIPAYLNRWSILVLILVLCSGSLWSQDSTLRRQTFLTPAEKPNKKRIYGLTLTTAGVYTGAMIGLNKLWYKDYPRSKFHFFNDAKEWQQIDKVGHAHTAYFESVWAIEAFKWAGMEDKKAAILGGTLGFVLQSSIEVLDGFSEEWGASAPDLLANGVGSILATSQELTWHEQRILLKFSTHHVHYPKGTLRDKADNLYGTGSLEKLLKDYNRQAYWVSINTASFFSGQKRAKWLNIAFGYGAGGMYGGFDNIWEDELGESYDYSSIARYRQFLISIDIDFTRIPTNSQAAKVIFYVLNVFKMPAPAMELNTKGQVIFHPMYFLNWNVPIYLKR